MSFRRGDLRLGVIWGIIILGLMFSMPILSGFASGLLKDNITLYYPFSPPNYTNEHVSQILNITTNDGTPVFNATNCLIGSCLQLTTGNNARIPSSMYNDWWIGNTTLNFWVRFNNASGLTHYIFRKPLAVQFSRMYRDAAGMLWMDNDNGADADVFGLFFVPNETWSMITMVTNDSGIRFYQNGSYMTMNSSFFPSPEAEVLQIGSNGVNSNNDMRGQLDEFIRWNRTLTASEITSLYNGGRGLNFVEILGGIIENSQTFTANTLEGNLETFTINITYGPEVYSNYFLNLVYNGTSYSGATTQSGNNLFASNTINIPSVTASINRSFYWQVGLINSTSTTYYNSSWNNQSVSNILIGNCEGYNVTILNYTLKDEKDQTLINGTLNNGKFELDLQIYPVGSSTLLLNFSRTWNSTQLSTSNARICFQDNLTGTASYSLYTEMKYSADGYDTEYNYLQNFNLTNSSIPQNINLLDINSSQSTLFLVTYKGASGLPIENAILVLSRKYVGEGVFKTVEMAKTDKDGQGILHFDTSGIYTIYAYKDNILLSTHDNIAVWCDDLGTGNCKINLYASSRGELPLNTYDNYWNIRYQTSFNQSTRTYQATFSTVDNTVTLFEINLTKYGTNTQVCYNSVSTSAGTLTCVIAGSYSNITFVASLTSNGNLIQQEVWTIAGKASDLFGDNTLILVLLLLLTLPLMLIPSTIGVLIGAALGSILSVLLIGTSHSILGTGSAITWIILVIGIIIWKISQGATE